jgi:hypothetical protein
MFAMSVVGPFKRPQVILVPADEICGHRQQLDVLRLHGDFPIGA